MILSLNRLSLKAWEFNSEPDGWKDWFVPSQVYLSKVERRRLAWIDCFTFHTSISYNFCTLFATYKLSFLQDDRFLAFNISTESSHIAFVIGKIDFPPKYSNMRDIEWLERYISNHESRVWVSLYFSCQRGDSSSHCSWKYIPKGCLQISECLKSIFESIL